MRMLNGVNNTKKDLGNTGFHFMNIMNRFFPFKSILFISLMVPFAAYGGFWSSGDAAAQLASAHFDEQMNQFDNGRMFVEGMRAHVGQLRKRVEDLQQQTRCPVAGQLQCSGEEQLRYAGEANTRCFVRTKKELDEIAAFLENNQGALGVAYDQQHKKGTPGTDRVFNTGIVFEASEKLKRLKDLEHNFSCREAPAKDDLQRLYDLGDQRASIDGIQVRQIEEENKRRQETAGSATQRVETVGVPYHETLSMWTNMMKHPRMVMGGVVLGVILIAAVLKDKIDAWLLSDDEQDSDHVKKLDAELGAIQENLMRRLKKTTVRGS